MNWYYERRKYLIQIYFQKNVTGRPTAYPFYDLKGADLLIWNSLVTLEQNLTVNNVHINIFTKMNSINFRAGEF